MLFDKFSELRLTDAMSIILIVILAGAVIGGLRMAIQDRKKRRIRKRKGRAITPFFNGKWSEIDPKRAQ